MRNSEKEGTTGQINKCIPSREERGKRKGETRKERQVGGHDGALTYTVLVTTPRVQPSAETMPLLRG